MKPIILMLALISFSNISRAEPRTFSCTDWKNNAHSVTVNHKGLNLDGQGPYKLSRNPTLDPLNSFDDFHKDQGSPSDLLLWWLGDGSLFQVVIPHPNGDE